MAMTLPHVMSLSEFVERTDDKTLGIFRKSRQQLRFIETLVDELGVQPPKEQPQTLELLVKQCRAWLLAKQAKNTTVANKRKQVVSELLEQASQRLAYLVFEKKKTESRNKPIPTKALAGTFKNEREAFARLKEQSRLQGTPIKDPPAGTAASELINWFHSYPQDLEAVLGAFIGEEREFWERVLSKTPLSEMQVADYERMMTAFGPRLAKEQNPSEVVYLSKSERLKHMVLIRDGLLYLGIDNKLTTEPKSDPANGWLYAVDRYGNIFCGTGKNFDRVVENGVKRINHSSFNAGKDVIVAGVIYAKNGKLTYIDNASGHYQASREQLMELIEMLRAEQVDIRGVEVGCMQPVAREDRNKVPNGQQVAFYLFRSVAEFLADQGGVLRGEPAQGPPKEM